MLHTTFHGSHYEIGLQLGCSMAQQGNYILSRVPFPLTQNRIDFAQSCLPHYRRWFPAALEELRGLAEGQGCPFGHLAGVLLSMYALPPQSRCSCFALRGEAGALFGRNSDFLTCLEALNTSTLLHFTDAAFPFIGNTTAYIEMEDGVNGQGLAVGLTSVPPGEPRPGLNAGMVLRLLLETCADVPQALDLLGRLPMASSHTLVLADWAGEIALAECSPDGTALRHPREEHAFVCSTNAFHLPEMIPFCRPTEDDWQAEERYQTLVQALSTRGRKLDIQGAMDLLSGKMGFLCQYDRGLGRDTVWSSVYHASSGRLWRAEGNPGRVPFHRDCRLSFSALP